MSIDEIKAMEDETISSFMESEKTVKLETKLNKAINPGKDHTKADKAWRSKGKAWKGISG
jgi:hypothetical protein